jgi:TRAP transporter 4TM/12TM fusion protein
MADAASAGRRQSVTDVLTGLAALVVVVLATDMLRLYGGVRLLEGWIGLETHYFLALAGVLLPLIFLNYRRVPWLDELLALSVLAACAYLFSQAERILDEGWEFGAPPVATGMSLLLWLLLLEALRRSAGWALFLIAGAFSVLPLVTSYLPGPLSGLSSNLGETAAYHALSIESIFGLPFRAFANLVIGFLLFGIALQHTGGGAFFLDLAFALLGHVRGGPAKVAILSSGLMGSMSGSVVTNVLTTGQMTIPAMKRVGMPAEIAGGVEACASTGGVLLPPIMGSTAFVMATFLELPYYQVALAAALPALLYLGALFLKIDATAARRKLAGVSREELPRVAAVLKRGWHYLGAFALLIFLLLVMQREAVAPYVATLALLVLNQLTPSQRWSLARAKEFLVATGRLLVELSAILAGVGLIVGALSVTGLSGTLVNDLLYIAGDETWLLLVMGAVTSFVLGIGMTVTAAYIFLAVILAPALVTGGLDPIGVHLFILYWAMLSFITPPVALGAYAAATVAGSNPIRTGFAAMRLGSVIYVLPFIFVLEPGLLLTGTWQDTLLALAGAALGLWLMIAGLQGYLQGVGRIRGALWRAPLVMAGAGIAFAPVLLPG